MKRFIIPLIILLSFFTASGQIADTTFFNNAKPMLGDPKSAINFWTGNAFFHGNIIADTIWGTTRIDVFSYDTIQRTRKIYVDSLILENNVVGTSDSLLIRDNGLIKYKILDMTPYLSFSDTSSTLLTQSRASNTYQLKYWNRVGTAFYPINADISAPDTVVASFFRLKNVHTNGIVLAEIAPSGKIDTIKTRDITSDTLNKLQVRKLQFDTLISKNGIYSIQTLITLADSTISFDFPDASTGFAEIQVDTGGYYMTYAIIRWSVDGTVLLQNKGANMVQTNSDGNHTILDAGTKVALTNRMGYSCDYIIKYTYHL